MLVVVPNALAAPSTPGVSASTGTPTTATSATFSWGAATPDPGYQIVRYEGGLGAENANLGAGAGSSVRGLGGDGVYTFRVRAVESFIVVNPLAPAVPDVAGAYGTVSVRVDRTPPTISVGLSPGSPNGTNGWYRSSVRIDWSCADAGAGLASCPPDETISAQGAGPTRTGRATDVLGNQSGAVTSPPFKIDSVEPAAAPMRAPSPNATVAPGPTFVWGPSPADASGLVRYEVLVRIGGRFEAVARVPHTGASEYRTTQTVGPAIPNNADLRWYVRTYDGAGNQGGSESQSRAFRVNPTVPGPATFTAGPNGPTNVAGPTFAWTGAQPSFAWELSVGGTETILVSGSGPQTQALLPRLPDGDYTFAVSQVTAGGLRGVEATRSFQVNTVAPAAPVITAKPPFPTSSATPAFSWTTEPAAFSRWRVIGAGGAALQSSDSPLGSTVVGPLRAGAYNFRVSQVNAAGNESAPALEPFSIVGPASARKGSLSLPRQNAKRLRPRAGTTVLTRRPLLRWKGGPRGANFYNLQVFRVLRTRTAGKTPPVKKIYSVFPRKRVYRLPTVKVLPGTCYVWRVWPYVGSRFTGKPLGVSNFCVASAKRLRATAAKAAAKRRAARAR